ncbi:MAG: murein biosynthesis integral membrane protein MurJ [Planctomycetota bacterium]|jgi:putative peptidoglycan lipid II flippase
MIRGFRQIASLTAISRVFGMLRDMAFAYFLGASGMMDGWVIAFKIPNLARRLFGEGAAASSLIPVYSEQLQKDPEAAKKLASTVVTVIFIILAAIVLLGEVIIWGYYSFFSVLPGTDLKLTLSGIMLPYTILICVVAILAGILNAHRHFAMPAAAPIVLNIFIISALCIGGWALEIQPASLVFVVAVAVIVAGFVQLSMQLQPLRKREIYIRPAWQVNSEPFKKIIILMGPMILGLTATQINTLADDFIALWFSGSPEKGEVFLLFGRQFSYPMWEGAVSHLFYSQRLYQFPLGVLGISLATAVFPVMSAEAAKKDFDALIKTVSRGIRAAVFIALPATAGLLLVRNLLVSVIFQRGQFTPADTDLTANVLLFYSLGLCGFFTQQVVTRAFYSTQDSKMPARSALIAVCLNIVLNLTLIWFMGTTGLALSTALCSYLQVAILIFALRRRFGNSILNGLMTTLLKTFTAAILMWLLGKTILCLCKDLPDGTAFDILRLAVVVPAAAAAYWMAAKCLRIRMLSLITGFQKNPDFKDKH